jgi:hypothetical protein
MSIHVVYLRTETIINGHLSKLIFQDANLPFVLLLENVVDESRLPRAKEACDDCDGSEVGGFGHGVGSSSGL